MCSPIAVLSYKYVYSHIYYTYVLSCMWSAEVRLFTHVTYFVPLNTVGGLLPGYFCGEPAQWQGLDRNGPQKDRYRPLRCQTNGTALTKKVVSLSLPLSLSL